MPGQGNDDPLYAFADGHAVVTFHDYMIYDPSYGESYEGTDFDDALKLWENYALDFIKYINDSTGTPLDVPNTIDDLETQMP